MKLSNLINLNRVKILGEDEDSYRVRYAGSVYKIAKDSETSFIQNGNNQGDIGMRLELRTEQTIVPKTGIFQDEDVPWEYKEVMIFHELKEMEYQDAGFEDAHQKAVHDEILYVIKFFDDNTRNAYLRFAERYRKEKVEIKVEKTELTLYDRLTEYVKEGVASLTELRKFYYDSIISGNRFKMKEAKELMDLSGVTLDQGLESNIWDYYFVRKWRYGINEVELELLLNISGIKLPEERILSFYDELNKPRGAFCGGFIPGGTEFFRIYKITQIPPTIDQINIQQRICENENHRLSGKYSTNDHLRDINQLKKMLNYS